MLSRLRRRNVTVGLDIGSGSIKAAAIDHSPPGPRLLALTERVLAPEAIVEGEVMDSSHVMEQIHDILRTLGIRRPRIVIAIGGRDVIVKTIQTQRMSEEEARQVLPHEAERNLPHGVTDTHLDFHILGDTETGDTMDVLLVAAKTALLQQRLELFTLAGLDADIIDVFAFALHNALQQAHPEALQGSTALVDLGYRLVHAQVLQDGRPVSVRDRPVGIHDIHERLIREGGLSAADARTLLRDPDSLDGTAARIVADASAEIANVVAKMLERRSLDPYEVDASSTGPIYLCGGGALFTPLVRALEQRLSRPLVICNPLSGLGGEFYSREGDLASKWMLPVGLALRCDD